MPKSSCVPTRNDLERLVPEIVRVINQSYAYLLWFTHVFPGLTETERGYRLVIQNNLFEGTLLNLRKLNEFFKTGEKRDDDARAHHFPGFTEDSTFLKESDLKKIHKSLAHLTYHNELGSWNMAKAMEAALKSSLPFLDYLIRDFYGGDEEKAILVIALKNAIPRVLAQVEKTREVEESAGDAPGIS